MNKWVYLKKDRNTSIILAKDSYKSVAVQILWHNDIIKPDAQGELVNHRNTFAVYTKSVFTHKVKDDKQLVKNENFKRDLADTIQSVKKYYDQILQLESMIDGSLIDYLNQNKEINTEKK